MSIQVIRICRERGRQTIGRPDHGRDHLLNRAHRGAIKIDVVCAVTCLPVTVDPIDGAATTDQSVIALDQPGMVANEPSPGSLVPSSKIP